VSNETLCQTSPTGLQCIKEFLFFVSYLEPIHCNFLNQCRRYDFFLVSNWIAVSDSLWLSHFNEMATLAIELPDSKL
jgi:hypothetical protein